MVEEYRKYFEDMLEVLKQDGKVPLINIPDFEIIFIDKVMVDSLVSLLTDLKKYDLRLLISFNKICYSVPFLFQTPELIGLIDGVQIIEDKKEDNAEYGGKRGREQLIFFKKHKVILLVHPLEYYLMKYVKAFSNVLYLNEWMYSGNIKRQSDDIKSTIQSYFKQMLKILEYFNRKKKENVFVSRQEYDTELKGYVEQLEQVQTLYT